MTWKKRSSRFHVARENSKSPKNSNSDSFCLAKDLMGGNYLINFDFKMEFAVGCSYGFVEHVHGINCALTKDVQVKAKFNLST